MKVVDILILWTTFAHSTESDANQRSHHGHLSYNLESLAHLDHRPPTNITATNGVGVDFLCKVKVHECGNFFSIVWYKETSIQERVYVYRHHSGVSKAEGSWSGRASHVYDTSQFLMIVSVTPINLSDQGRFRCEVTYEDQVGRWFKDSCLVAHVTNLVVFGPPDFVRVSLDDGTEVSDGSIIGPYPEGRNIVLRCEASGGRPVPEVSWWNNTQKIINSWDWRVEHENSTGSAKSEINFSLTRFHLDTHLTCLVNSSAMKDSFSSRVHFDVNVSPSHVSMSPEKNHIEEGGKIVVTCTAFGAKPKALIYWQSDPKFEHFEENEEVIQTNKTFTTISKLTFKASRELTSLSCFATNKIMDEQKMPHLSASSTVNVKYKPEITIQGLDIVYIVTGDSFVLNCSYQANPSVSARVIWYKNGNILDLSTLKNITSDGSVIKLLKATRSSSGLFSCRVENEIGSSEVIDVASVYVEDVPEVVLDIFPITPISEPKKENVTLTCTSLPPADESLVRVKWFLDGEILKELPECNYKSDESYGVDVSWTAAADSMCNMDPSKIILENVGRNFQGNYSCQGKNRAGWGQVSNSKTLLVYYPPVSAEEGQYQSIYIRKGESAKLRCALKHLGHPEAEAAVWLKDGIRMKNESALEIIVENAGVDTDRNYTCIPFNEVGKGAGSSVSVVVTTKPSFVTPLPAQTGANIERKRIVLTCIVECSPLCSIKWYKNNSIVENSTYYQIIERIRLRDYTTNTLSHVVSELVFNIDTWVTGSLRPDVDTATYTCASDGNREGPGVNSTTMFRVHFPPKNIRITPPIQTVKETLKPRDFYCTAEAYPPAKYFWQFTNGTRTRNGPELEFRSAVRRSDGGKWTCTAFNELGNIKAETNLNVVYKPECSITKEVRDKVLYLRCQVEAFPPNVTYYWYHNENLISSAVFSAATQFEVTDGMEGEFSCQARNLAGLGNKCDVKINGPVAALVAETDLSLIIIGTFGVVLLTVLIVLSVVLCRKWNNGKYNVTLIHTVKQSGDADEDNKQIVCTNGKRKDANNSVVVVPVKKIKVTTENGRGLHQNGVTHVQNTLTTTSIGNPNHRTIQRSPKILTARKRTKNGMLKAPTELWLV